MPARFRMAKRDGENVHRLAAGVHQELVTARIPSGNEAGLRLIQAAFMFRSADIGEQMRMSSQSLTAPLEDTGQLVRFADGGLEAFALTGVVDLAAASLYRLHFGNVDPGDPGREADVHRFPNAVRLPASARRWLKATKTASEWTVLKDLRDGYVHRWFPMHLTVTLGATKPLSEQIEVGGVRRSLDDVLAESRTFTVDRLISVAQVILQGSGIRW